MSAGTERLVPGAQIIIVALTWDAAAHACERASDQPWAVIEGEGPVLGTLLSGFAASGTPTVGLVGVSGRRGPAPLSWLRRVAGDWLRAHEGRMGVMVWPTAVAPGAELPHGAEAGWRQVTGTEAPMRSEPWDRLPGFRYHLLLCAGIRCKARGADAVAAAVAEELRARSAQDEDVLVTRTLCQYPCNAAPIISVYPDNIWLTTATPDSARALVARLLDRQDTDPPGLTLAQEDQAAT